MVVRLIQTADLHLGMAFKSLSDNSKLHRIDCQNVFSKIIDIGIKEKVSAFLIGGDLFDNPDPPKSLVRFVINELERLEKEKITVFIISGNHDPYKKGSVWLEYKFPKNVVIFDSSELEPKRIEGLTVYGLAYTDDTKQPLKSFKAEKEDNFKVGLAHGSTTNVNREEEPESGYRPISKEEINNSDLDYIALGHFHDLMNLKTKIPCCYSGTPEGLTFKNNGDRFVILVSYSDKKVNVKPIKVNKREFKTVELDCTNFETEHEIEKLLEKNEGENNILRLILKGSPSLDFTFDVDLLMKEYESKYFFLKIVDNVHVPDDLTEDETIRGTFIRLVKAEIKKEKDGIKRKRLENALRIGIGYLDKKM
ncbi:MAG: DNA repair exonuclease [Nanoarchaeota archaeon]|nr:DNA repair exonuclease [Nanoarchaeota archaeon]MCG2717406.1 DNA repair exonuclease [Nanoarchaeota archaeon]